jgi:hypothetical protein
MKLILSATGYPSEAFILTLSKDEKKFIDSIIDNKIDFVKYIKQRSSATEKRKISDKSKANYWDFARFKRFFIKTLNTTK